MDKKEPLELGLKLLENRNIVRNNEYRYISSEFGFVRSWAGLESSLFTINQPYRIKEGRIALVKRGSARISINLIEYTFQPYNFSIISPGSIIQLLDASPDFDLQIMAIHSDFIQIVQKEEFFNHFLSHHRNILLTLTKDEWLQLDSFFSLMWDILQEPVFRREVIQHLLTGLLFNIEYISKNSLSRINAKLSHQEEIFQRFITLVNAHSKSERTVGFYADKLCLTPRYLNTVIRQTSQQTVMQWIDQSITLEAKVLLKHSSQLVYQISDELNFPNPSFFCKFFKRMTGMTPQKYQKNI